MEKELIELGIAIVILALIMVWLRGASKKSREEAPASIRERLGVEEVEKPKRERKRKPEPKPEPEPEPVEAKPEPKPKKRKPEPEPEPEPEVKEAFKAGLAKTRGGFVAKLGKLFGKKQIDAATVDELEEVLFTADIGPRAAERIFQSVKTGLTKSELENADKIWEQIRKTSRDILAVDSQGVDMAAKKPFVLLVLGVNGVGKTTTIGKLASKWKGEGKKVILAAG